MLSAVESTWIFESKVFGLLENHWSIVIKSHYFHTFHVQFKDKFVFHSVIEVHAIHKN